jgi:hypothetical protein
MKNSAFGYLFLVMLWCGASAFSIRDSKTSPKSSSVDRRDFIQSTAAAAAAFGTAFFTPSASLAKDEYVIPTRATVTETFGAIKYEVLDPNGGVAIIQKRIDEQDWAGVMEYTQNYDLEMRKIRMGRAKKLMATKEVKEKATSYANAVTFDLIGINRNSRSGQENVEGANKYLQELRDDAAKFLELESTIPVEG